MNEFKNLIKQIDTCDVVSFDIFDTLLLRPFVHPHDVFAYLELYLKERKFKEKRIKAENKARKKYQDKEEITLDNIYEMLPKKYLKYKTIEENFEYQILTPNLEMKKIFDYAKSKNKIIVIISDMYLSKNFLSKTLNDKGFLGYKELFVSSDIGYRKSSTKLYDFVKNNLGISPNKIIHIGDNQNSDYSAAIASGFKAYCYKSVTMSFFNQFKNMYDIINEYNHPLSSLIIGSYIIRWHNDLLHNDNFWSQIGYLLAGILALGYVQFIKNDCKHSDFSDIFFIARDGFVLQKIFDLINTNNIVKSHYVYAPRNVRIFGLCEGLERKDYLDIFLKKYPELNEIIPSEVKTHKDKLKIVIKNLDLIKNKTEKYKNEYLKYLNTLEISGNSIAIVDLGSNSASSQYLLTYFLGNKIKKGFYWGVNKKNKIPFIEYTNNRDNIIIGELIEFLISSPELPIVGFEDGNVLYHTSTKDLENNIRYFQKLYPAEIELAKNFKIYTNNFEIPIEYSFVCKYFNNFIKKMNKSELENFSNITWQPDITHNVSVLMSDIINKNIEKQNARGEKIIDKIFRLRKSK